MEVQIYLGMDYQELRTLLDHYRLEMSSELKLKTKKTAQVGKPEPEGNKPDNENYTPTKYRKQIF